MSYAKAYRAYKAFEKRFQKVKRRDKGYVKAKWKLARLRVEQRREGPYCVAAIGQKREWLRILHAL